MIEKIFLHWTAGRYDQLFDDYHVCIDDKGRMYQDGAMEDKKAHTYLRNSHSVGIALCCCYGASVTDEGGGVEIHWGDYPPTRAQIACMAVLVAVICHKYGLKITKDTVMTHAEVAEIDGYGIHGNDPDLRWDLLELPGEGESGGELIRDFANDILANSSLYDLDLKKIGGEIKWK